MKTHPLARIAHPLLGISPKWAKPVAVLGMGYGGLSLPRPKFHKHPWLAHPKFVASAHQVSEQNSE